MSKTSSVFNPHLANLTKIINGEIVYNVELVPYFCEYYNKLLLDKYYSKGELDSLSANDIAIGMDYMLKLAEQQHKFLEEMKASKKEFHSILEDKSLDDKQKIESLKNL
ncbi:hypothetical protein [Cytobacillus praedii]|uniref:Uncharacterized protein n=1 Tax=Cytobacillus praedii TaxID=1742358 RepID=A0A4R1AT66_9BACI|nr:hypothetical protein [Cytobacillus praedii]TCJ00495.1 hypothetical protein E0Y62_26595 [Cytobacillus praedii]